MTTEESGGKGRIAGCGAWVVGAVIAVIVLQGLGNYLWKATDNHDFILMGMLTFVSGFVLPHITNIILLLVGSYLGVRFGRKRWEEWKNWAAGGVVGGVAAVLIVFGIVWVTGLWDWYLLGFK